MLIADMLSHTIPPGKGGPAALKGAINAEFFNMDEEVFPCGTPRALDEFTSAQLADLPSVFRQVNAKHMAFPGALTLQRGSGTVDMVFKIAVVEWAVNYPR